MNTGLKLVCCIELAPTKNIPPLESRSNPWCVACKPIFRTIYERSVIACFGAHTQRTLPCNAPSDGVAWPRHYGKSFTEPCVG